jgi:hypothetical protein
VCPFSKLVVARVDRLLVLFVVTSSGHASAVCLERVSGNSVFDILVIGDINFAGKLDVVVLFAILALATIGK